MGSGEDFDGWEGLSELNAFSDHSSDADVGDSFSDGVDFDAIDDAGSLPFGSDPGVLIECITSGILSSRNGEHELQQSEYPEELEPLPRPYYSDFSVSLQQERFDLPATGRRLVTADPLPCCAGEDARRLSMTTESSLSTSSRRLTRSSSRTTPLSTTHEEIPTPQNGASGIHKLQATENSQKHKSSLSMESAEALIPKKLRNEICYCEVPTCEYSEEANAHRAAMLGPDAEFKPKWFTRYHDRRRHYKNVHRWLSH